MSDRPDRRESNPGGSSRRERGGTDVLTDVLNSLGLESRLFCRSELTAPWGLSLPPGELAHFHAIERGAAWLHLDGRKESLALSSGDLVVLPHGRGHQLSDSPGRRPVPLARLARSSRSDACSMIRHGGGGPETLIICGSFRFERREGHPLLSLLPEVIHLPGEGGRAPAWLEATLRFLAAEARDARPGGRTVITRLTDVLFIHVVRAWIEAEPAGRASWLSALKDPRIGAALGRIHAQPERAWTVAALAAEVGMSRSPFAARFTALVGQPPLTYLARWRLQVAARLLRRDRLSLAEAAARVGYESEAAFSKAFKRGIGVSPGAYRRRSSAARAHGQAGADAI